MSELLNQQFEFTKNLGLLIEFIHNNNYTCTVGDAYAHTGHCKNSFHYRRLAMDLNLFKDGKYLKRSTDYYLIGKFWISLGGTWGGSFRNPDGNHFSWGE